jgi:hypothetical protein
MKKVISTILLATLVFSIFGAIVPVHADVVGTMTVSTTQFYGNAVVQVQLYDPDMNINPSAIDTVPLYITINYAGGTTAGPYTVYAKESGVNTGDFYLFIGSSSAITPSGINGYNEYKYALSKNDKVVITYYDTSPVGTVQQTITYKPYSIASTDITFDRAEYPMNAFIRINIHDPNFNLDPTVPDTVSFQIMLTDVAANLVAYPNLNKTITTNFIETGPNTGVFRLETSFWTNTLYNSYALNFTGASSGDPIQVTFMSESSLPYNYFYLKSYKPYISVGSGFTTAGDLDVTIVDPNLNQKSWVAEDLSMAPKTNVTLVVSGAGGDTETFVADFAETDYNTGQFQFTVPVVIGNPHPGDGTIELRNFDGTVTMTYYEWGAIVANAKSDWSTTAAAIATDKTMYKANETVTMTLIAPDENINNASINFFSSSVTPPSPLNAMPFYIGGQDVGELTVKVNGILAYALTPQTFTFIETAVGTGMYNASMDLSKIVKNDGTSLTNGDQVTLSWYDVINDATSTATFRIGVPAATLTLDRSSYPVPREGQDTVYIVVNSSISNKDSSLIETVPAYLEVYYYNGKLTPDSGIITLTESGADTGIFKKTLGLPLTGATNDPAYIGGWFTVSFTDPSTNKNITATATFVASEASVTTDKSVVNVGDNFTVMVLDQDNNFDSKTAESVTIGYEYTPVGATSTTKGTWTLTESDVNTANFNKTITIGDTLKVEPGTTITLTFNDSTPGYITASGGYPATDKPDQITATVKVASHTGTVYADKSEYGIGSQMTVTVVDPDLNTDIYTKETVDVLLRASGYPDVTLTLTEAGLSSSIFNGTYTWPNDTGYIGQTFAIYYKDKADASGNTVYESFSGMVKSWDGTVTFDKAYYNVGDIATITINDMDQNYNPNLFETVKVTVTSTSDPVGGTILCTETDVNTGIFVGKIQVSSEIASGKVYAVYGDTLTASYKDPLPADYVTTTKAKTFTGTAIVGVPVARPVPASNLVFIDPSTGLPVTSGKVGMATYLQATVTNVDVTSKSYTAYFEVKDSTGATIYIAGSGGTLAPSASNTPFVSWVPPAAGTYTVNVLVVKSLSEPTPYSDILTTTLTVS